MLLKCGIALLVEAVSRTVTVEPYSTK